MAMKPTAYLLLIFTIAGSCTTKDSKELPENYFGDLEIWKQERDQRLRAESGFVNLAGLFWLSEGENTFGHSDSADLTFPEGAPEIMGTFILADSEVWLRPAPGIEIIIDSVVAADTVVYDPASETQPVMEYGSLRWYVIERAGNLGIRLKDLEHPMTKQPLGIPYFEASADAYVTAQYVPFDTPDTLLIDNIIGHQFSETVPGELIFNWQGEEVRLLPLMDENGIFLMFADGTSGIDTYGGGRYLTAGLPDSEGHVVLDFNRAYNPPCAFTPFATCPLPPEQNRLTVKIRAGEMDYNSEVTGH